jgi:hypothetical protein
MESTSMSAAVDSKDRPVPKQRGGAMKFYKYNRTLPDPPHLLFVLTCALIWLGWVSESLRDAWVLAAVSFLFAYGRFTTWVRLRANTGGRFIKFLERIRQAIAYEDPASSALVNSGASAR